MSVWYQATPNGLVGSWITNRSKPVLCGSPRTLTRIVSFCDPVIMVTRPLACLMQAGMPADGFSANEKVLAFGCEAALVAAPAEVSPRVMTEAAVAPARLAAAKASRRRRAD